MAVKRSREEDHAAGEVEKLAMANCLMLLARLEEKASLSSPPGGDHCAFTCKTCNRNFRSFQALGGHRASHKRPRLVHTNDHNNNSSPPKPKTHECSVCGLEFSIGQALGGHMRRHRATTTTTTDAAGTTTTITAPSVVPVLKRSNSSKRVLCLDLNLMPPYESEFKLETRNFLF